MAPKILDTGPKLTDEQLDNAMLRQFWPAEDENILLLLRHLHRRLQALEP